MKAKYGKRPQAVCVGYGGVPYTIYVHEDMAAKHKAGRQAKFLTTPARMMLPELGKIVRDLVGRGTPIQEAMLIAGRKLQEVSQRIVPYETWTLHDSAFTVLEKDLDSTVMSGYEMYLSRMAERKSAKS